MDFARQTWHSGSRAWRALPPRQQIWATVGLALGISLLTFGVWLARRPEVCALLPGESLTPQCLRKLELAFAAAGLREHRIEEGHVWVASSRQTDYLKAVSESGAMPLEFGAHVKRAISGMSVWASHQAREQMLQWAKSQDLAVLIGKMPQIEEATVIYDSQSASGLRRGTKATALVSVQPVGAARLPDRQAEFIRKKVAAAFNDLAPEDVEVIDDNDVGVSAPVAEVASLPLEMPAPAAVDDADQRTDGLRPPRYAIAVALFSLGICGLGLLRWFQTDPLPASAAARPSGALLPPTEPLLAGRVRSDPAAAAAVLQHWIQQSTGPLS